MPSKIDDTPLNMDTQPMEQITLMTVLEPRSRRGDAVAGLFFAGVLIVALWGLVTGATTSGAEPPVFRAYERL